MDSGAPVQLAPTGRLRAAINLGNPVMAQGTPDIPRGVTVYLSRHIAAALGVPVASECVDAAEDSFGLLVDGRVDIAFVAIEPARAEKVAFTVHRGRARCRTLPSRSGPCWRTGEFSTASRPPNSSTPCPRGTSSGPAATAYRACLPT